MHTVREKKTYTQDGTALWNKMSLCLLTYGYILDFLDVRQIYLRLIKNVPLLSSHNNEKVPYQQAKTRTSAVLTMFCIWWMWLSWLWLFGCAKISTFDECDFGRAWWASLMCELLLFCVCVAMWLLLWLLLWLSCPDFVDLWLFEKNSAFDECDCGRAWRASRLCEWSWTVTSTSGCTPTILSIVTKPCQQWLGLMRGIYLD